MSISKSNVDELNDSGELVMVSLEDCVEKTNNLQSEVKTLTDQVANLSNTVKTLKNQLNACDCDDSDDEEPEDIPEGYNYCTEKFRNLDGIAVTVHSTLGDDTNESSLQIWTTNCDMFLYEDEVCIYSINGIKVHRKPTEEGLMLLKELKRKGEPVKFGLIYEEDIMISVWDRYSRVILLAAAIIFFIIFPMIVRRA